MQRQRQELSQAVRELTDNSNSIYQEMNRNASGIKKRTSSTSWTETDLDSLDTSRMSLSESITPLYIETMASANSSSNIVNCSSSSKISDYDLSKLMNGRLSNGYSEEIIDSIVLDNDDLLEGSAFSNLSQQEKQEIKTVRIVKRESQQRQRDRERTGYLSQNLDQVLEEEAQLYNNALNSDSYNVYQRSKSLPRTYMETHEAFNQSPAGQMPSNDYYNSINVQSNNYPISIIDRTADLYSDSSASQQLHQMEKNYVNYYPSNGNLSQKTESIQSLTKMVGELSPVFRSEAARQIIIEMASGNSGDDDAKMPNANKQRRAVPKEKRRHFTAPHHVNAKTVQTIQSAENDMNKNVSWCVGAVKLNYTIFIVHRISIGVLVMIWIWKLRSVQESMHLMLLGQLSVHARKFPRTLSTICLVHRIKSSSLSDIFRSKLPNFRRKKKGDD